MRRLELCIVLALLLATCRVANAELDVPDPTLCEIPDFIDIVCSDGLGNLDPRGSFEVIVRSADGTPCVNMEVLIDFLGCHDVFPCTDPGPGQLAVCGAGERWVSSVTNIIGVASFNIRGGANNTVDADPHAWPGCGLNGVVIFAGGVVLGRATAAVFDQDGARPSGNPGISAIDLAYFSDDLGAAALFGDYRGRSDYDHSGSLTALDLGVFAYAHGGPYVIGCAGYCP